MKLFDTMMSRFVQIGSLTIIDAGDKTHTYGKSKNGKAKGPNVTIRLTDPKLGRALFINPELRAGEAYMDGSLVIEQGTIRDLLTIFATNRLNLRSQPFQKALRRFYKRVRKFHQRNPLSKSRKNVSHHYDISNELYRLFLDKDLNYSCAYFTRPGESLETAQRNKLRHIAAKLDLKPGLKILDIGSGWGAMALYLAEVADVKVVGVTLSTEQLTLAKTRARERGLDKRVTFKLMDYRDVGEKFDRIVSIGMFEHVGIGHHHEYFAKINDLLRDDGVALVHSIGRKGGPGTTGAWIRKYIFPGGYSPALSETFTSVEKAGLWVSDVEILRMQYADTLAEWDRRFQKNRKKAARLFDERFCRMWEFYLIASEFSFRYGKHMNFQLQLTKDVSTLPYTRDYLMTAEAELKKREARRK
jgi:cyclopropane-fatty-acyl-phospholipid synthase